MLTHCRVPRLHDTLRTMDGGGKRRQRNCGQSEEEAGIISSVLRVWGLEQKGVVTVSVGFV